jgi:general secretion pathway protein A
MGAAMLTGVFGCGKTLIAQTLLQELSSEQYKGAFIANPRLDEVDLLRMVAFQLGTPTPPTRKADVLNLLQETLLNNMRNGKQTVVIIDEAHSINDDNVFEEIRLLMNFQLQDRFLLTLVLLGQPELKQKIEKNIQLEQRINVKGKLDSLSQEDTKKYIIHRLEVANRVKLMFSDDAVKSIYDYSGGIPRRINRLCDMCLLAGFARKAQLIDNNIVQEEIKGFE